MFKRILAFLGSLLLGFPRGVAKRAEVAVQARRLSKPLT